MSKCIANILEFIHNFEIVNMVRNTAIQFPISIKCFHRGKTHLRKKTHSQSYRHIEFDYSEINVKEREKLNHIEIAIKYM